MQIIEVNNKSAIKKFLSFPVKLYKGNPSWIRPLDKDIESVFDRKKNTLFRNGDAVRWILIRDGVVIGRIAAFFNKRTLLQGNDQPTGGIGFFECLNDISASELLFDTAKEWLQSHDIEAMDGPINFGERNAWWGLLVDGFDKEPIYQSHYHLAYYQNLFESYGFQVYYKQYTFSRLVEGILGDKLSNKAKKVQQDKNYSFQHIKKNNLSKYAEDFRKVYNEAWSKYLKTPEMSRHQANFLMKKMKPIMDEKIIWFAYYKNEAVGFYVGLPDFNQIVKYLNGKLNLWGKLIFLWLKLMKKNNKMVGVVFGFSPDHQGKGLDGAISYALQQEVKKQNQYDTLELNWIADFNPAMIKIAEQLDTQVRKVHHTYRYLFDRNKPFKRMKIKQ